MIVVSSEAVPILSQEGKIYVRFGRVQSWGLGGISGRETSLIPHVDLILDYCVGSFSLKIFLTVLYNG